MLCAALAAAALLYIGPGGAYGANALGDRPFSMAEAELPYPFLAKPIEGQVPDALALLAYDVDGNGLVDLVLVRSSGVDLMRRFGSATEVHRRARGKVRHRRR